MGRTAAWGDYQRREDGKMGVQGREDSGVGRPVTRGAQQRREDGNAGRAVAQEGSNVGRTDAWVGQQRLESGNVWWSIYKCRERIALSIVKGCAL